MQLDPEIARETIGGLLGSGGYTSAPAALSRLQGLGDVGASLNKLIGAKINTATPFVGTARSLKDGSLSRYFKMNSKENIKNTLSGVQMHEKFEAVSMDITAGMNRHKKLLGLTERDISEFLKDSHVASHANRHVLDAEAFLAGQSGSKENMLS